MSLGRMSFRLGAIADRLAAAYDGRLRGHLVYATRARTTLWSVQNAQVCNGQILTDLNNFHYRKSMSK